MIGRSSILSSIGMKIGKGLTLLEVLVVLALISLLILISIPNLSRLYQGYRVKTAVNQLAVQIRFARNEAVTRKIGYKLLINSAAAPSQQNTYEIQYNLSGSYQTVPDLDFSLPGDLEVVDNSIFSGGIATISFNSRGGATSAAGSPPYDLELKSLNGTTYRVRIFLTGSIYVDKTSDGA